MLEFTVIGKITAVEIIARGGSVRVRSRLNKIYGRGEWRKVKGTAMIRLANGRMRKAELHWYQAHGIGRRELKLKQYLDHT